MPRPKLKTDDQVLDAANVVLKRCGPIDFTLSEVSNAVGLSRAALIQRFTNRDTLLVKMMERSLSQVRTHLDAMPNHAGSIGLWTFLQTLVRSMNTDYDFSVNFLISWYEVQIPELHELAIQRNRSVVEAIRERLPIEAPMHAEVLIHAVIAGATAQWVSEQRGELAEYVLVQLAALLRLMFPNHDDFRVLPAPLSGATSPATISGASR